MQVLVFQAEERLVLALPVLELAAFVAFVEEHLHPVLDLRGAQTQLQAEAEDARFRGPAELLVLGVGIAPGHGDRRGALHPHALVVVLIEDQEGAAVCGTEEPQPPLSLTRQQKERWAYLCRR